MPDREAWDDEERRFLEELGRTERDAGEWFLPEQTVEGLDPEGGPPHADPDPDRVIFDVVVRFTWPGDEPPEIVEVTRVARADGSPLGAEQVSVDLRALAVAAVLEASPNVQYRASDGSYRSGGAEAWRVAAMAVRAAAARHGRVTWTPALDDWLAAIWRERPDLTATRLADALGMTASRVRARLSMLRDRWGEQRVPSRPAGRPPEHDDDEEETDG